MRDKKSNPESFHEANQPDGLPEELERRAGEMPADEELKEMLAQWSAPESFVALDHQVLTAYRQHSRPSFWRRLMTASIRVPMPVMAAAMLFILLSAAVTLRALSHEPQLVIQAAPGIALSPTVHPPSGEPEVITRTIYVAKKTGSKCGEPNQSGQGKGLSLAVYEGKDETGYFTHGDLSGFQPTEEMSFKVIKKEVKQHEK